jgi:hypothetical protein
MTAEPSPFPEPRDHLSRRVVLVSLAAIGACVLATALVAANRRQHPRRSAPLVDFEVRMPAGILLPDDHHIGVMLWAGNLGRGCHLYQVRRTGNRPVVAGNFIMAGSEEHHLSLQLSGAAEGYWSVSIDATATSDDDFGPWQKIVFTKSPRLEEPPLPPGDYEVRYRVKA